MTALIAISLLIVLAGWVLAPALREGIWKGGPAMEKDPDEYRRRRDNALEGLRDLEMDREMGKVEEVDYARSRREYEGEAVAAIRRLDEMAADPGEP